MKARLALLLCIIFVVCLLFVVFALAQSADEKRNYHPYTIAQVVAENPLNWKHPLTHLSVDGWVTYKVHEADGDWHIRICESLAITTMDPKHCMVAEIIPTLPRGPVPKIGDHINVQGIYRWDGENPGHHWAEIHPVEQIGPVK